MKYEDFELNYDYDNNDDEIVKLGQAKYAKGV